MDPKKEKRTSYLAQDQTKTKGKQTTLAKDILFDGSDSLPGIIRPYKTLKGLIGPVRAL